MHSDLDAFAQEFDSITPDPSMAFRVVDDALRVEPETCGPGFYLLDDAEGRFTIDHETGIITLAEDALLALEPGAVHHVLMRTIEQSGSEYEMRFALRITGRVPQIVSDDPEPAFLPPAPEVLRLDTEAKPPLRAWAAYDAFRCVAAGVEPLGLEDAAFGALIAAPFRRAPKLEAALALGAVPPEPAPRGAY